MTFRLRTLLTCAALPLLMLAALARAADPAAPAAVLPPATLDDPAPPPVAAPESKRESESSFWDSLPFVERLRSRNAEAAAPKPAAQAPAEAVPSTPTSAAAAPAAAPAPAPAGAVASADDCFWEGIPLLSRLCAKAAPAAVREAAPTAGPNKAEGESFWDHIPVLSRWFGKRDGEPAKPGVVPPVVPAAAAPASRAGYVGSSAPFRAGIGTCVRSGTWTPGSEEPECAAPAALTAADPSGVNLPPPPEEAATPAPRMEKPEPAQVKRLEPSPVREERSLEAEAKASASPSPKAGQEPADQTINLSSDALFALSSAKVKPQARGQLDAVAAKLMTLDYAEIKVLGHADASGAKARNFALSKRRAEAVLAYLKEHGVNPGKIQAQGMGSGKPANTERDCSALPRQEKIACYAPDRRVEIVVVAARPAQ